MKRDIVPASRLFDVGGVSILGNPETGAILGLRPDGRCFVERLLGEGVREVNEYDGEERAIVQSLDELGFLGQASIVGLGSAFVHLTDRCNLHCVGCYSYVDQRNAREDLGTDDYKVILDKLASAGVRDVVFSGGEPFLRADIAEIAAHAKSHGMWVALITNGTVRPERCAGALPFIDILHVSVDGFNEAISFIRDDGITPRVLSFIREMKQRCRVHLIVTLHRQNVRHIADYVALARREGVTFNFSIFSVDPSDPQFEPYLLDDRSLESVAEAVRLDEGLVVEDSVLGGGSGLDGLRCTSGCGAGRTLVSVGADGTVYPCHMLHDGRMSMGNLVTEELGVILGRQEAVTQMTVDDVAECAGCEHRYFCGGGCRGRSFLHYGTVLRRDPFCELSKSYLSEKSKILALTLCVNIE